MLVFVCMSKDRGIKLNNKTDTDIQTYGHIDGERNRLCISTLSDFCRRHRSHVM